MKCTDLRHCKWPELADVYYFIKTFWKVFTQKKYYPKVDENEAIFYIVTKMSDNDPHLDCSSLLLLDDIYDESIIQK